MGLIRNPATQVPATVTAEARHDKTDALLSQDAMVRRTAVKRLDSDESSTQVLLEVLANDASHMVVEAALDRLYRLCQQPPQSVLIIDRVVALLPEMGAATRNSAILFLSSLPDAVEAVMPPLLTSTNKDLQLYALDILRGMNHPRTSEWLALLLQQKLHENVLISGLERAADCQCTDLLPVIRELSAAPMPDPAVAFAFTMTLQRLGGPSDVA